MPQMSLYLLGPPRLECNGNNVHFNSRKTLALLAYLAVTGQAERRDSLVNLLWPDKGQKAGRGLLRNSLHELRKICGGDWIEADRDTIGLADSDDLRVDVRGFRAGLAERAHHGQGVDDSSPTCRRLLTETLELYRGDFLTGFTLKDSVNFDNWQTAQTDDLRQQACTGYRRLLPYQIADKRFEQGIAFARRWLEIDRLSEEAHRSLMELYHRTDRRSAALRQYKACVQALEDELGVSPDQATIDLQKRISNDGSRGTAAMRKNNLPRQLTSFIGREREMAKVSELLGSTRLLTLTGSGGCGKTRLALQVARSAEKGYRDGVCMVQLASLENPQLVPRAVAAALGLLEQPRVMIEEIVEGYLAQRHLLMVLDNCEHLIEACAGLTHRMLGACPKLSFLATSREALRVAGETAWRVPPLSFPEGDDDHSGANTAGIEKYEAVRLFVDRAVLAQPSFTITKSNSPSIAGICRRLDGMPLAIELAAARMAILEPQQILPRLDDRFRLLARGDRAALPRHRTLRATVDWSYELLSDEQQTMLRRLSVFVGGWTLEAAEAACGSETAGEGVLEILIQLVNKSMVIVSDQNEAEKRYTLLETIRHYGQEKLAEIHETERMRGRHRDWFLDLIERAEPNLRHADIESLCHI